MFKHTQRSSISRSLRAIHTVPKLTHHETWSKEGIPGLFTPKGYNAAWTDYQNYLNTNLTLLTNGTANETKSPYQILLNTAKQTTQQHTYHYAAMSHMNHFFFQQLADRDTARLSKPSRFLMEKLMHQDILDVDALRSKLLLMAENAHGQGWVYLVEDKDKNLQLLTCHNDGTPYYFAKRQQLDFNSGIDELSYKQLENMQLRCQDESVKQREEEYMLPILAINFWDHMYVADYGVNGKAEYLNQLWEYLNWDVINKRLFQI
ncbi:mitochondrial 37S ribosomal protein mS42 [Lodderomyces beijingensis]|uniref:Manganese/iron superoxide dismutase C-terminal domain-containing protein n=1 Tax=Lodderomyces beijingensis TaxID=1775926 RepID=A0ABP0ZUZ6_9ASCO